MGVLKHRSRKWKINNKIQVQAYQIGDVHEPTWLEHFKEQGDIVFVRGGANIKFDLITKFVPNGTFIINGKHGDIYSCTEDMFDDVFEMI